MLNNKAYDRKNVSLKKDLESFLFSHSKSFSTATPEDIRLFLVNHLFFINLSSCKNNGDKIEYLRMVLCLCIFQLQSLKNIFAKFHYSGFHSSHFTLENVNTPRR